LLAASFLMLLAVYVFNRRVALFRL
jgi:hypothetical protein